MTIDPCNPLRFLYQGVDPRADPSDYLNLPYRLGLLTAARPNPISAMCRAKTAPAHLSGTKVTWSKAPNGIRIMVPAASRGAAVTAVEAKGGDAVR